MAMDEWVNTDRIVDGVISGGGLKNYQFNANVLIIIP